MKRRNILLLSTIGFSTSFSYLSAQDLVDKDAPSYSKGDFQAKVSQVETIIKSSATELPEDFDFVKAKEILGLSNIKTYAQSSTPDKEEFINRIFLDNGGDHKGVFKLFGEKATKFSTAEMAPSGTDLAMQVTLDLATLEDIIRQIIPLVEEGDIDEFNEAMTTENDLLEMTTSELLKKLQFTANIVLDLEKGNQLPTPIGGVDRPHLAIRVDKINWVWEKMEQEILENIGVPLEKNVEGNITTYTLPAEVTQAMMGYAPSIIVDNATNQFWIVTTHDFYKKCSSGVNTLGDSAIFKQVAGDLNIKGSSFAYISKDFADTIVNLYDSASEQGMTDGMDAESKVQIDQSMADLKKIKTGAFQIFSINEKGIFFGARDTSSIDEQMEKALKQIAEVMSKS